MIFLMFLSYAGGCPGDAESVARVGGFCGANKLSQFELDVAGLVDAWAKRSEAVGP